MMQAYGGMAYLHHLVRQLCPNLSLISASFLFLRIYTQTNDHWSRHFEFSFWSVLIASIEGGGGFLSLFISKSEVVFASSCIWHVVSPRCYSAVMLPSTFLLYWAGSLIPAGGG